jgi:hypothetical protein
MIAWGDDDVKYVLTGVWGPVAYPLSLSRGGLIIGMDSFADEWRCGIPTCQDGRESEPISCITFITSDVLGVMPVIVSSIALHVRHDELIDFNKFPHAVIL